jgi:hypothetical protein
MLTIGTQMMGSVIEWWIILLVIIGVLVCLAVVIALPEFFQIIFPIYLSRYKYLIQMMEISLVRRGLYLFSSTLCYLVMWIILGIGFYFIMTAMMQDSNQLPLLVSIGVFSFSWLAGFISIFTPGGIGIRESVITIMLNNYSMGSIPILAAILSRLMWTVVEIAYFFASWYRLSILFDS